MKDLCYEHSFYEPEWLHYVRGLARADQKGAVLIDVVADLLLVAAGDTQAMQQLVGLIAADLLLEEPSNQLVLRSLREARHTLNDELRLKIRNRLWTAYLGNADKTTDIAGVPIDKTLFFEATKQILAQVYPEEIVVQKKRP
jgi:hypothetical protein